MEWSESYKQKVVESLIARGQRRRVDAFWRGANHLIEFIYWSYDHIELYAKDEI